MSNPYSKINQPILRSFWFSVTHLGYCRQEKKYFHICSTMNLKKIRSKLEKMAFYIVVLAMFEFIVVMPLQADMGIVLGLPGTYKIILERQKFLHGSFNFTT